jgi:hypothetical protein
MIRKQKRTSICRREFSHPQHSAQEHTQQTGTDEIRNRRHWSSETPRRGFKPDEREREARSRERQYIFILRQKVGSAMLVRPIHPTSNPRFQTLDPKWPTSTSRKGSHYDSVHYLMAELGETRGTPLTIFLVFYSVWSHCLWDIKITTLLFANSATCTNWFKSVMTFSHSKYFYYLCL